MNIKEIIKINPDGLIGKAYKFAQKAHFNQKRKSGEPYITHPLAVADILISWDMDDATIAAGLLHDVLEDTAVKIEELKKEFGEGVTSLVDGVSKIGQIKYRGVKEQAENMRKLIFALSKDLRIIFIRLADRLHNMRTLKFLPKEKQKRIALETDEIYASIAYRLGMHNLAGELKDLAFPYIYPEEYKWVVKTVGERYNQRLNYLKKIAPILKQALLKNNIQIINLDFRAKRWSSLYKKLLLYDMDIEKIYDLVALRVIVPKIKDCYAVLGIIHDLWPPLPGRIKDYIASPKPNGYKSLHTTVFGPENKKIEIQIRTPEMHYENEFGIAAHWIYKHKKYNKSNGHKLEKELSWIKNLSAWQEEKQKSGASADEFLESLKIDFFKDRIFVITPKGDVVDLPVDSTPVDFAYHIHSEIGNSCAGAKVNDQIVPLDYKLKSGDVIEILTQKNKKPSEDWLSFVKTSVARDHIKSALKQKGKLFKIKPSKTELKISVEDRIGLIKDISSVISRSHFNILSFHTEKIHGSRYQINRLEIDPVNLDKIKKLILKLKNIDGVKEVSYKII